MTFSIRSSLSLLILFVFTLLDSDCFSAQTKALARPSTCPAKLWQSGKLPRNVVGFPASFLWGTGISEYQVSGAFQAPESNWAYWEARRSKELPTYPRSGRASDFWRRYKADIAAMKKDLGVNSFRFSVEWSIIEPREGHFDEQALQHYIDLCDELLAQGIKPMITLHHFTHPEWFEQKGAFEKEENISYFVRFCRKIFELLGSKVHLWCTINEPTIYVLQGYIRGVFPPGNHGPFSAVPTQKAAEVLKNLLQAHMEVYRTLKHMPYGSKAQIGLVHQYLKFEPYSFWNPFEHLPGWFLNTFLNDAVLNFCATGVFSYKRHIPFLTTINVSYTASPGPLMDFIGLNYYSRVLVTFRPGHPYSSCYPGQVMTDMPYASYPEGFYNAIKSVCRLGLPVYITETGISDRFDNRRGEFIRQYLQVLYRALQEGCDIRGFYYWTLIDNYEWDLGYDQQFGLYKLDHSTQKRSLRTGAQAYARIVKNNAL